MVATCMHRTLVLSKLFAIKKPIRLLFTQNSISRLMIFLVEYIAYIYWRPNRYEIEDWLKHTLIAG